MASNREGIEFINDFFSAAAKEPTIKDIADRYKVVMVKCPCCEKTIKVRIKV